MYKPWPGQRGLPEWDVQSQLAFWTAPIRLETASCLQGRLGRLHECTFLEIPDLPIKRKWKILLMCEACILFALQISVNVL